MALSVKQRETGRCGLFPFLLRIAVGAAARIIYKAGFFTGPQWFARRVYYALYFLLFFFPDFSSCTRSFSVIFVAFDFEEWEFDCSNQSVVPECACGSIDCGSRAFVANFTQFYNGSLNSNGKLQGAIIMDTMFNYNTTPHSQLLPSGVEHLAPEIYHQIKEDEFRGDFLSMVGRQVDDAALLNSFWYHYSQVKSGKQPSGRLPRLSYLTRCLCSILPDLKLNDNKIKRVLNHSPFLFDK